MSTQVIVWLTLIAAAVVLAAGEWHFEKQFRREQAELHRQSRELLRLIRERDDPKEPQ